MVFITDFYQKQVAAAAASDAKQPKTEIISGLDANFTDSSQA